MVQVLSELDDVLKFFLIHVEVSQKLSQHLC
jgi:hypothetical protein